MPKDTMPFTSDWMHRMYSVSKTFVNTAIGLLADEGRISLDDKICDYFKDKLPENPHPYILVAIRICLLVATTHAGSTYKPEKTRTGLDFLQHRAHKASGVRCSDMIHQVPTYLMSL